MDITAGLLSESFAESMLLPMGYVSLLGFLVKQYLTERRSVMPHAATLVGFYRCNRTKEEEEVEQEEKEEEEEEEELAGTVEVSFNKKGANASPPTPTPPKNSPYICNMTVKKPLRRFVLFFLFGFQYELPNLLNIFAPQLEMSNFKKTSYFTQSKDL